MQGAKSSARQKSFARSNRRTIIKCCGLTRCYGELRKRGNSTSTLKKYATKFAIDGKNTTLTTKNELHKEKYATTIQENILAESGTENQVIISCSQQKYQKLLKSITRNHQARI
jgi:hypothetical protein